MAESDNESSMIILEFLRKFEFIDSKVLVILLCITRYELFRKVI